MQFTSIVTIIASVAFVSAQQGPPSGENNGQACKVNQKQACCETDSSGVLGGLLGGSCELNILGQNCAGQTACCEVDGSGSILGGSCQPVLNL